MLLHGECDVALAESADAALARIAEARPDLILLDLVMPGRSGLELLEELRQQGEPPPVIVLTATKTITTAVEAMKLGAADYVTKPFEVDALRIKIRNLLQHRALEERVAELTEELEERSRLGALIGRSEAMRARVPHHRARRPLPGERADQRRERHRQGAGGAGHPRAAGRAAARALRGDQLRGDPRDADGERAVRPRARLPSPTRPSGASASFEQASGGTLFLDEIAELPPAVQAKLLRALQERSIERVGGRDPIAVDARFVAATNRDLAARGGRRALPPGSLLPDPRGADRAAAAARAPRGRAAAGRGVPRAERGRGRGPAPPPDARGAGRPRAPRLARQRARAPERHRARGRALRRHDDRPRGSARGRGPGDAHRVAARCGARRPAGTGGGDRALRAGAAARGPRALRREPDARRRHARDHAPGAEAEDGPLRPLGEGHSQAARAAQRTQPGRQPAWRHSSSRPPAR